MPTIRDVAAHAKVSAATVSHVINGTRPVHPSTVERVQAAIEALSYRPNSLARGLRRNETGTIGLFVPDNTQQFFAEIARAIEDVGFAEGYSVILCNSYGSAEKEAAYIELLLSKRVDGLILISSGNSFAPLNVILKAGVPCVVVDRELGGLPVDQVLVDNEQGGYQAAKYLVNLGHRRIGYITGPSNVTLSALRLAGFKRAMAEAGLLLPDTAIIRGDFHYKGGAAATQELLRRNLNVTALFAANDRMALAAIGVLHRAGLRVPADISVMGFDDIPEATAMYPSLTTVAQPIVEMAQLSISLLLDRLKAVPVTQGTGSKKSASRPSQRIVLPLEIIERESCGPPPSAAD